MTPDDSIFTTAVHAGEKPSDPHGSLSPALYLSSVFAFPDAEQATAIHEGEAPGYFYGRMGTPTQAAFESAMCELERGEAALALASGMAAISTALLSLLRPGDEVVAPLALYATTGALLDELLAPFGVVVKSVDGRDPRAFAAAAGDRTRLFYLETPSNPTLQLIDIEAVVEIARRREIPTVLDNTFATPVNQRPLDLGVDLVVHSATKYLGGHGDLMAGVLVGSADWVERARWHTAKILGGTISPLAAWLALRGLRTLPLRMARHNRNALQVAEFLAAHPKVVAVHYPGLPSHPQRSLAERQMSGGGGMLAFAVGSREAGLRLVASLELCRLAVSLGDTSTLIQLSAAATHHSAPAERRRAAGIGDGLLRLSVGLERPEDIVADLERGLQTV